MSISDDIEKWLQWAGEAGSAVSGAFATGKITSAVYNALMAKINSIQSDVEALEQGEGVLGDAEAVVEISGDVAEVSAEIVAAGVVLGG
jgi:hypothetical protein